MLQDNQLFTSLFNRNLTYYSSKLDYGYLQDPDQDYLFLLYLMMDDEVLNNQRTVYTLIDALCNTGGFI